jgi:hypothetical protein
MFWFLRDHLRYNIVQKDNIQAKLKQNNPDRGGAKISKIYIQINLFLLNMNKERNNIMKERDIH